MNFRQANVVLVVGLAVRIADPARKSGSKDERANGSTPVGTPLTAL